MEIRPAQSTEYIRVKTAAVNENGATVDPTSDPVAIAFVNEGATVTNATAFVAGTWETDVSTPTAPVYYARVLAGPGQSYIPTAATRIDVYVKVSDSPEVPIQKAGTVRFT